jgi:hypothetical protein
MNTCTPTADLMVREQVGPSLPAFRIRTRTRKYTSRETVLLLEDGKVIVEGGRSELEALVQERYSD